MKEDKLIITSIAMIGLAGSIKAVLNGCTKSKCIMCAQTPGTGNANQYNRYCTHCEGSQLTIAKNQVDQKCTGEKSSIANCRVEMQDGTSTGRLCYRCHDKFALSADKKSCTESRRGCESSELIGTPGESCLTCRSTQKFQVGGSSPNFYVQCVDGGIEIPDCRYKGYEPVTLNSESQSLTQRCEVCKKGYSVKADGTCVSHGDQYNIHCIHATPITNQCAQCNWYENYWATGTAMGVNDPLTGDKNDGNQLCFSGILTVVASFGSVFFSFLRF